MKSFEQFKGSKNNSDMLEEKFIRKGAVLAFANQSKTHGDQSVKHFNNAKQKLNSAQNLDIEGKLDALIESEKELLNGLNAQRIQIGFLVSVAVASAILSEKTNSEIQKLHKLKQK